MLKYILLLLFVTICASGQSGKGELHADMQRDSASESGYQGIAEIGYGFSAGNNGLNFLKVNIINGYKVNPRFYVGAGTGLRLYFDNEAIFNTFAAYPIIPFFADFRVNFDGNKVSPYASMDIGYAFDASDGFDALGLLINPSAGITFRISEKVGMNIELGFDFQQMKTDDPENNENRNAISFVIGFDF